MVGIVISLVSRLGKVTVTSLAQMNPWSLRYTRHWQTHTRSSVESIAPSRTLNKHYIVNDTHTHAQTYCILNLI